MKSSRLCIRWLVASGLLVSCDVTRPCSVSISAPSSHDLELVGAGACSTTIELELRVATGTPTGPIWTDASAAPIVIGGHWTVAPGGVARTLTVSNPSASPISLVALEWSTGGSALSADRLLHNGYQSWSYAGIEAIGAALPDANGTAPSGGADGNALAELPGVSWWWTAVSNADGDGLVAGADGATVLKTYLATDGIDQPRLRIVEGNTGDSVVLAPGETRSLDGIFLALGNVSAGLEAYTAYVSTLHSPAMARQPALGGWGSWNFYYAMPTAAALRTEVAWAQATLAPVGLADFLLDDGYEPAWGTWQAGPSFGATLPEFNAEQTSAGLHPAVWLAPFYVAIDDPIVASHPERFVHDTAGALTTFYNFGPTYATLDVTNADARASVVATLQQYRDWGYRTMKLDFLFGGAIEGVRERPVTALESYQLWMQTVREAVPDVHLVGCGAPLLPSVGWVDSMRTGPDIAFATIPAPMYGFAAAQARQTAMRSATDHFWSLDPDVVLLRGDGIDDREAWTAVVSAAMAGGKLPPRDGRQTSPARLAMAVSPDVLAISRDGVAARALDLTAQVDAHQYLSPLLDLGGTTGPPHVWRKVSRDGLHTFVAVFAWNDANHHSSIALPADTDEIMPPTIEHVGAISDVAVPAHGVRLFRYPTARAD